MLALFLKRPRMTSTNLNPMVNTLRYIAQVKGNTLMENVNVMKDLWVINAK